MLTRCLTDLAVFSLKDQFHWCTLGAALSFEDHDLTKDLVKKFGADPNLSRNSESETLLSAALMGSQSWAVKQLLKELGACPDQPILMDGSPVFPIFVAIQSDFSG